MIWALVIGVSILGIFASGFFSGSETGLYCVNRLRVHLGVQQREARLLRLSRLVENEQRALTVTLIGNNFANYMATTAVAYLFAELLRVGEASTEFYTILLVTPTVFVFGELIPKNLFRLHADALMPRACSVLILADWIFGVTGVVWLLMKLTGAANRLFGGTTSFHAASAPKRHMTMLLQEALVGHAHGEHQSDLVDRVVRLSDTPVRAVMVPQHQVVAVAATAGRDDLMRLAKRTDFARCPVYGNRRSTILGVIKVDELLRADDWKTVGDRIGPVTRLRPQKTVASAIAKMKRTGGEFGVVTDPSGQMIGVVTLRDLLEEVVGEFGPPL